MSINAKAYKSIMLWLNTILVKEHFISVCSFMQSIVWVQKMELCPLLFSGKKQLRHSSSFGNKKSNKGSMVWRWVDDYSVFFFGWIIPFSHVWYCSLDRVSLFNHKVSSQGIWSIFDAFLNVKVPIISNVRWAPNLILR